MNFIQSCLADDIQPWNQEPSHIPQQFLAKQPPRPKRPRTSQPVKANPRRDIVLQPNTIYFIQHQTEDSLPGRNHVNTEKRISFRRDRPQRSFSNLLDRNGDSSGIKLCKSAMLPTRPGTSPQARRNQLEPSKNSLQFKMVRRSKQQTQPNEQISHNRADFTMNLRQKYSQSLLDNQKKIQTKLKRHQEGSLFPVRLLANQPSSKRSAATPSTMSRMTDRGSKDGQKPRSLKRGGQSGEEQKMGLHLALERKVFLLRQKGLK